MAAVVWSGESSQDWESDDASCSVWGFLNGRANESVFVEQLDGLEIWTVIWSDDVSVVHVGRRAVCLLDWPIALILVSGHSCAPSLGPWHVHRPPGVSVLCVNGGGMVHDVLRLASHRADCAKSCVYDETACAGRLRVRPWREATAFVRRCGQCWM
jgi:hypothetical protein